MYKRDWIAACLKAFTDAGHKPQCDERGKPDEFALCDDQNFHNGFACEICYACQCVWCWEPDTQIIKCEAVP